jgi:hypothetical protein
MARSRGSIVVTGDVSVEHHVYMGMPQPSPTGDTPKVHQKQEYGGAPALRLLLDAAMKSKDSGASNLSARASHHNGFALWNLYPRAPANPNDKETAGTKKRVWRARADMSYQDIRAETAKNRIVAPYRSTSALPSAAKILVIDDLGFGFRDRPEWWPLPKRTGATPNWVILKMSNPVVDGLLWNNLVERFNSQLICLVSASKLRQKEKCGYISRGLSWQCTIEDIRRQLLENPAFESLSRCRHLIITFSVDGALWLNQPDPDDVNKTEATLIFDPEGAEGEWKDKREGVIPSYSSIVAAAITYGVARTLVRAETKRPLDLRTSIQAGLRAVRLLCDLGHGHDPDKPRFPLKELAKEITRRRKQPRTSFAQSRIPWPKKEAPLKGRQPWELVEALERGADSKTKQKLLELACDIAMVGTKALRREHFPYARFGKLCTVDRHEIEALRLLRRQMNQYRQKKQGTTPLSVGVFGDPGAGKSFGVKQIAEEVFGHEKAWLEFNLSQFNDVSDLLGAFHQVRDKALFGLTPIVFWDEFDSNRYDWLKYLLAPMQDGRFQEGKLTHSIGKSVFIFAGGIHSTYEAFVKEAERLKPEKVPDFCSRLDAFYNVLGPNPRPRNRSAEPEFGSETRPAVSHWLQRALMMWSVLGREGEPPKFSDPDLLRKLLRMQKYRRGARSLKKLVAELRHKDGSPILWSDLPAPALLGMHLEDKDIKGLVGPSEESS